METLFDHNPTDYELTRFGGREQFDFYKSIGFECSQDDNYYMIGLLYAGRGDDKTAAKYFNKIKNRKLLVTLMEDF